MKTVRIGKPYFEIGDKVKYSPYEIRKSFDSYLEMKGSRFEYNYKKSYEDKCAVRGTVEQILENGIQVRTNSGEIHKSLDCLWEKT